MTYKTASCTQVIKAGTCEMNKNFTFGGKKVSICILVSEETFRRIITAKVKFKLKDMVSSLPRKRSVQRLFTLF